MAALANGARGSVPPLGLHVLQEPLHLRQGKPIPAAILYETNHHTACNEVYDFSVVKTCGNRHVEVIEAKLKIVHGPASYWHCKMPGDRHMLHAVDECSGISTEFFLIKFAREGGGMGIKSE